MAEKINTRKKKPQLKSIDTAPPFANISVNYCKNQTCENFGVPYSGKSRDPNYGRSGTTGAPPAIIFNKVPDSLARHPAMGKTSSTVVIKCRKCKDHIPLKNNEAIWHTVQALSLKAIQDSCPNVDCDNHFLEIAANRRNYKHQGKTSAGTQRWQCLSCKKTFSQKRKRRPQRIGEEPHKRENVTRMLVNGIKLNRILEIEGISPTRLYQYIDKAYESCVRFNSDRSSNLKRALNRIADKGEAIYLATDRQDYLVNWPLRNAREAIVIRCVATVDSGSGFVFRHDVGIDDRVNADEINSLAAASGDLLKSPPVRKYAQYILGADIDYMARLNAYIQQQVETALLEGWVSDSIEAKYYDAQLREDIELPSGHIGSDTQLPRELMLIREDYALYAHYHLLGDVLPDELEVVNFADFESGLRAAFMAAFAGRVLQGTAHLFNVTFKKGPVREEREAAAGRARRILDQAAAASGGSEALGKWTLCREVLERHLSMVGPYRDRMADFPWETKTEVEKRFICQTFRSDLDLDRLADHLVKASLHQVDTYFQQVRRRISGLERGIPTASKDRRIWHGNHFYRPDMVRKSIEIFRTFKNYHYLPKTSKQTPASSLGVAKGQVKWRDIINY